MRNSGVRLTVYTNFFQQRSYSARIRRETILGSGVNNRQEGICGGGGNGPKAATRTPCTTPTRSKVVHHDRRV